MSRAEHLLISHRGLEWEKVVVVPFTVYLDDSGTSPSQQVACATALIIPAPRLMSMEAEWKTLKEKEGLSDFHTSICVARNYKSEFAHWDDDKLKRVFNRVCEITAKYVVQIFSLAVNKPDYDAIVPPDFRKYIGNFHYTWAVQHVLSFAQRWRLNNPEIPAYEWIFDFMKPGDAARTEIEDLMEQAEEIAELQRGVSGEYLNYGFRPRKTLAGLQCADLVAWTNYQFALEKFKGTPINPFAKKAWDDFKNKPDRIKVPNFPDVLEWNFSVTIKPDHLKTWVDAELADGRSLAHFKEREERKKASGGV